MAKTAAELQREQLKSEGGYWKPILRVEVAPNGVSELQAMPTASRHTAKPAMAAGPRRLFRISPPVGRADYTKPKRSGQAGGRYLRASGGAKMVSVEAKASGGRSSLSNQSAASASSPATNSPETSSAS